MAQDKNYLKHQLTPAAYPFIILLVLLSALVFMYLPEKKKPSPLATQSSMPSIYPTKPQTDDLVTYSIPPDWKKGIYTDPNKPTYSFSSPDYADDGGLPLPINGATILLSKIKTYTTPISLDEAARNDLPYPLEDTTTFTNAQISGKDGLNTFFCWESCFDAYYFFNGNDFWKVYFECAPGCDLKEKSDKNVYKKDLDVFLQSLSFQRTVMVDE